MHPDTAQGPPSSPESSGKPGPQDSHTRPGPCPWAPGDHRGNSPDISRGEGPTQATVQGSRMVGTSVQAEFGGREWLLYLLQVHPFHGKGMGARPGHGIILKYLEPRQQSRESWGSPRVLGRKAPGGSEAIHFRCLGPKPAQSPVGLLEKRLTEWATGKDNTHRHTLR